MEFDLSLSPDLVAVFLALFLLEVVLGVDNVIFISILAGKLPEHQQAKARKLGLSLAMLMRVVLIFFAGWIITLTDDFIQIGELGFSMKDLILIAGGVFLLYKAIQEIHHKFEGHDEEQPKAGAVATTFGAVIAQILALDLVFSLDSVITAVGMTSNMIVIIAAVLLSFGIMLFASGTIFAFVNRHPPVKMLALSFLLLIAVFLIAEGFGVKIDKALIYGPMAFAVLVETLNLVAQGRAAKRRERTALTEATADPAASHAAESETQSPS